MPLLAALLAATFLLMPAATAPAFAHHSHASAHSDAYAMKKKAKKAKAPKAKKEEYMRAVPSR